MNANELADMAENACCAYQKEIASMLRQQQAEIQELKMKIHSLTYGERLAEYLRKAQEKWQYLIAYQNWRKWR